MFSVRTHAEQQFVRYLKVFPREAAALRPLAEQLEDDADDVFVRSNMRGHITTSALVWDPAAHKVLVIHHKLYNRWLQPGGHQEGEGRLSESAQREAEEETGVLDVALHPWHLGCDAPFDIDTHPIAEQPKKNEGRHVHHDFLYLFTADSTKPLTPQLSEVTAVEWISRDMFRELPGARFQRLADKLAAVSRHQ